MATKSSEPPANLQTQMDELDALLDRLLKLPLRSGNEPPIPPSPSLKIIASSEDLLESLDEPLEEPILRFGAADRVPSNAAISDPPGPGGLPALNASQFVSLPEIDENSRSDEARLLVPPEEMPWLDDEPAPQSGDKKQAAHDGLSMPGLSAPIATERFVKPAGAQLEILIGPTCTVISPENLSPTSKTAEPITPHPSRLRTFFWRWNLLFDMTAGRLVPSVRRANVKYFLGFVGLGLFIGSLYLAWHTWLR